MRGLNALGQRVLDALLEEHPDWDAYADTMDDGELQLVVPAPKGSRAKQLIVFTNPGKDVWIRYAPPRMCYSVDSPRGNPGGRVD